MYLPKKTFALLGLICHIIKETTTFVLSAIIFVLVPKEQLRRRIVAIDVTDQLLDLPVI